MKANHTLINRSVKYNKFSGMSVKQKKQPLMNQANSSAVEDAILAINTKMPL